MKADAAEAGEPAAAVSGPYGLALRKPKVKKGEQLWLMSFSDMSLILMSFFVLQLSFSTPDKRKYDNLNAAITKQAAPAQPSESLQTVADRVQALIKQLHLEQIADVHLAADGLSIEFRDQALFKPGSAEPDPAGRKVVGEVLAVIAKAPGEYKIVFEGHTDDVPVAAGAYKSNWELSAARGIALLNTFRARGVSEQRMAVEAFAATRPKLAVKGLAGDELKKARAANRRVVIRLQ